MKENVDINNKDKNKYLKIQLLHEYFKNFNKQNKENTEKKIDNPNIEETNNIYIKYLKHPNIIYNDKGDINSKNLKLLFDEINKDIDERNNIFFPFLNMMPNLVRAYIESDLDDDKNFENKSKINELYYIKIFQKLKSNCFIHKRSLIPIYDYFQNLYDIVTKKKELKENDIISKKFNKIINLFENFYDTKIKDKNKNNSSFCFLGGEGGINIAFNKEIFLQEISEINIKINFIDNAFFEYLNEDSKFLKINEIEIKYKNLIGKNNTKKLEIINIIIINDTIKLISNNNNLTIPHKISKIINISLLEEFYGQISAIEISLAYNRNKIEYQFLPYLLRNGNNIYYIKKNLINLEKEPKLSSIIPKIVINDKNLFNINYINYCDKKFDMIAYFGGIIQFLPLHQILKTLLSDINNKGGISLKENNKYINKENINHFLNFIIKVIINRIFSIKKKEKILKKYTCFLYYLLLDINIELDSSILMEYENKKSLKNIYKYLDLLKMVSWNIKNIKNTDLENNKIQELFFFKDKNEKYNLNFFVYPKQTLNQIYEKYMKSLFCYNSLWSKKYIFFPKRYNNKNNGESFEIKYKQLNYYTKNFILPFFYPILEYSKYYPKFSQFKNGINFFQKDKRNILEYDFKLCNKNLEKIFEILFLKENKILFSEKCCIVKNSHHVFGEVTIINNSQKGKNFKIIFTGKKENNINKKAKNSNELNSINITDEGIDNKALKTQILNDLCLSQPSGVLCYGSTFACPERDYNKNIIINSKDILFLLIRVYYHRVSAIEIFTLNKSYYFNFQKNFEMNNLKINIILNEIGNNPFFKKLKIKKDNIILGYYNIKYKPYLFPLFEDEINNWDKKFNYYTNFDILILINLLSNRSFRDVFQYPIFPMLYDLINEKRELNQHIGLQEFHPYGLMRKDIFLKTFTSNDEDKEIKEDMCVFNIHYSNPAFVFNYLLRILPYTFLGIEFQGDGFDDPNRLFFSIEKALRSSLRIKSDLREMIPELYYMIELFYNKNNVLFPKPKDGTIIDDIFILDNENRESKIAKIRNYAKFLCDMRNNLENRHINKWIDLIFGVSQKYFIMDEKHRYKYYEKSSEISFKTESEIINNSLIMDMVNFGLLPYQLFSKTFPSIQKKDKEKFKKLNIELFKDEHIKMNSPIQTFMCKGRILIEDNYIKLINPKIQLNKIDNYYNIPENIAQKIIKSLKNENFFKFTLDLDIEQTDDKIYKDKNFLTNYYFVGDIFGSVLIYAVERANTEKNDEFNEEYEEEDDKNTEEDDEIIKYGSFEIIQDEEALILKNNMKEFYNLVGLGPIINIKNIGLELKLYKQLNDHFDEIKYIDFNPRLNVFLSYSLDNFINIYIFPKLKLVKVIDTIFFKDLNDKKIFDRVVLLSYPFPLICCHNKEYIYLLSINGELIKYDKLDNEDKIVFSIDKNLGIVEDSVDIYNSEGKLKCLFNNF